MAKATATCTCEWCGKTWTKELGGRNRREADEKAEWYAETHTVCRECKQKAHEEYLESLRTDKAAPNADNPINLIKPVDLKGTEKQIKWAEDIREWLVEGLQIQEDGNNAIATAVNEMVEEGVANEIPDAKISVAVEKYADVATFLAQNSSASWWIEKGDRESYRTGYLKKLAAFSKTQDFIDWLGSDEANMTQTELKEQHDESLMTPENATSATEATITIKDNAVRISSDKDLDLIKVVKGMGCRWDSSYWVKKVPTAFVTAKDGAAEIANGLLNAGFPVVCKDAEIREMALEGTYTPIPQRRISYRPETDTIDIFWAGNDDSLYKAARSIKGSKWEFPVVRVNAKRYQEIEGFADMYGFAISEGARTEMDKAKAAALASTVKVAKHKDSTPEEVDLEAILERPAEVMSKHVIAD